MPTSTDNFDKWCINWVKVDVTKDSNETNGGMFLVTEEDNADGVSQTVLKLYNNKLSNCADTATEDNLGVSMKVQELQWGMVNPQEYMTHFGVDGDLGHLGVKYDEYVDSMKAHNGIGFLVQK